MSTWSPNDVLFGIRTRLGFLVRVTRARWPLIASVRYSVSAGQEAGMYVCMAEVRTLYDRDGKTLTVWFTDA